MERLADDGDGFVTYVSEREQARQLFVHKLPATLTVRALDAKVQVTFDPSTVASYRLVGLRGPGAVGRPTSATTGSTAARSARAQRHRALRGPAGQRGGRAGRGGAGALARPGRRRRRGEAATITVADLGGEFAGASPRLRVDYAAACFAEELRRSPTAGRYARTIWPRSPTTPTTPPMIRRSRNWRPHPPVHLGRTVRGRRRLGAMVVRPG